MQTFPGTDIIAGAQPDRGYAYVDVAPFGAWYNLHAGLAQTYADPEPLCGYGAEDADRTIRAAARFAAPSVPDWAEGVAR